MALLRWGSKKPINFIEIFQTIVGSKALLSKKIGSIIHGTHRTSGLMATLSSIRLAKVLIQLKKLLINFRVYNPFQEIAFFTRENAKKSVLKM